MSFFKDGKNLILTYDECKNIYRTATLGKRIVEGLVNFAMSAEREIDIHKAPPEAIEKFKETADEMKQDEAIKKTIYNSRIYGTGVLYVAMYDEEKEEDDFTTKPTFEDAHKYKMKFTVMDPLNISGSRVDLDPLSFTFLQVIDIQVNSKQIPKKRIAISHALEPLYLDSRTSLIPFSPPSVFYNMAALLNQYDDAIKSIGDLLYKAGAIIYKYPAKAKLNGVTIYAITASKQILEQKRSGEVISISADSTIEDFPISNLNGLIDSINKLEDDITKALNDTPASILFDKSLSNGFSEGDKDKETEISIIESFRENKLTPLYNLTDYYVMLKAWDSAFIDDMRYKYSEYQDKTDSEIFRSWAENFKFQYGNLFPEPESVTQDNNAKKLDNLLKAQQLGANPADLQEELNESEIFKNEMELDSQPQGMDGMGGTDAADDEEVFDYTQNDSTIKADASDIPPGTEWKTLENGEHILVNENGTIISGAGGNLKGKYFKNKNTGKFEKYTFNQQTLAAEAEREYNENKQKELEAQNNTFSEVKNISKTEYTKNRKDLVDLKDLLGFYQRELEQIHVNDKKNRAKKEEQINSVQQSIEKKEAENKKYEETKKKVNKGDKESKGQTSKEKKIGKTYSIAYDNDTIEKLKSLGKTWQDKRIYFKDLNNSYYDLVSEKWVTDSPETTKKAMEMASESLDDRENRLANAKKEAEEKKKREYEEKEAREKPLRNNVANKIKNKEEFSKQVIEKIKEHGYNSIDKGSVNKIASELFTEDELNAWKNANPYSSEIKDVLRQGDYQYNTHDEIDITPKSLIYDIMKNHFYAKKQNDKPLSFFDFMEVTNDTAFDNMSRDEVWEMYGDLYKQYKKEHYQRIKDGSKDNEISERGFLNSVHRTQTDSNFNKPLGIGGIKIDTDFREEDHPRKANGEFKEKGEEKEIKEKIEQLEKIDWTKDNTLPNFPKSFLKKQGLEDKPILLKKNIIEKNKASHPDITEEEAKRIIGNALYKPEVILKANIDKPAYHNFISRTDDKHNDLVLLELSDKKENYEIINYHVIKNRQREQKEKLDKTIKENS